MSQRRKPDSSRGEEKALFAQKQPSSVYVDLRPLGFTTYGSYNNVGLLNDFAPNLSVSVDPQNTLQTTATATFTNPYIFGFPDAAGNLDLRVWGDSTTSCFGSGTVYLSGSAIPSHYTERFPPEGGPVANGTEGVNLGTVFVATGGFEYTSAYVGFGEPYYPAFYNNGQGFGTPGPTFATGGIAEQGINIMGYGSVSVAFSFGTPGNGTPQMIEGAPAIASAQLTFF